MADRSVPWFFASLLEWDLSCVLEADENLLRQVMPDIGSAAAAALSPALVDEVAREVARETECEGILREAFALLSGRLPGHDRYPLNLQLFGLEGAAYRYVRDRYRLPIAGFLFPLLYLHAQVPTAAHARTWRTLAPTLSLGEEATPGAILMCAVKGQLELLKEEQHRVRGLVEAIADHRELPSISIPLVQTLNFPLLGQVVKPQLVLTLSQKELPLFDLAQYLLKHGERRPPRRCPSCHRIFLPGSARRRRCEACHR
ncbi:MAG: hypothetical protein V3U41_04565 [candidate division NC10 bacterium]